MHILRTWSVLALGLAVAACRMDSRRTSRTNATASAGNASSDNRNTDVVRYHGDGFEIELPPGSAIGHGGVVDTLRGPMLTDVGRSIRPPRATWCYAGADTKLVTLAMMPAPNGWAIADFIYPDRDLAVKLRKVVDEKSR